jgi:hypothetical protein
MTVGAGACWCDWGEHGAQAGYGFLLVGGVLILLNLALEEADRTVEIMNGFHTFVSICSSKPANTWMAQSANDITNRNYRVNCYRISPLSTKWDGLSFSIVITFVICSSAFLSSPIIFKQRATMARAAI